MQVTAFVSNGARPRAHDVEHDPVPPYRHIACLVDGSERSRGAIREAARLQELCGGRLTVVYVEAGPSLPLVSLEGAVWCPDPTAGREAAHAWLAEALASLESAEGIVLEGHPAAAISAWALWAGPDLIVASEPRSRLERALCGSPARYLGRHAPCPVLVLGERPVGPARSARAAALHV